MSETVTSLLAAIGIVYLVLTVLVYAGDIRRRLDQRERLEAQEWAGIVEAMRRMEDDDRDRGGNA